MTPETFFKNFALLADAPNGVPQLRALILQLAVQGKLVSQDPTDEPASVLLERIREERARLVAAKKIRKSAPLPAIQTDEMPFDLVSGWQWVRLGQVGDWGAGATPDRKQPEYYGGSIKWLKSGELNDGYVNESEEQVTEQALKDCSLRLNQPGDVLIAMYGATIGKLAILKTEATTNQAVCACTCFSGMYNRYLFYLLKGYKQRFLSQGAGGAQPNISREKIIHTVVPLPPLAEQRRIVAKVDQLMALCDELETRQQQRRAARTHLNDAALDQLLAAREPDEFAAHWQRLRDNFDLLYDTPETIGKLRQAILQLAVQGKLVLQDPTDEPALALLDRIRVEKARLISEGKIKSEDALASLLDEKLPFPIPENWVWSRFGEAVHVIRGASPRPKGDPRYFSLRKTAYHWIKISDIRKFSDGVVLSDTEEYLTEEGAKQSVFLEEGTLIVTNSATIGVPIILGIRGCIHDGYLAFPYLDEDLISKKYLYYFFQQFRSKLKSQAFGLAQVNINISIVRKLPLPLPPLAEQRRIVAKVEQFMALCDELEAQLKDAQARSGALLEAVVRQMLADGVTAA